MARSEETYGEYLFRRTRTNALKGVASMAKKARKSYIMARVKSAPFSRSWPAKNRPSAVPS
jgi:hypothetical protein